VHKRVIKTLTSAGIKYADMEENNYPETPEIKQTWQAKLKPHAGHREAWRPLGQS